MYLASKAVVLAKKSSSKTEQDLISFWMLVYQGKFELSNSLQIDRLFIS